MRQYILTFLSIDGPVALSGDLPLSTIRYCDPTALDFNFPTYIYALLYYIIATQNTYIVHIITPHLYCIN